MESPRSFPLDSSANPLIYFLLALASVCVLLESSFAPWASKVADTDSGVYIYCAKMMMKGGVIYKDLFDHKGPLIYVLNIMGLKILGGDVIGIWLVEVVSLFVAALFMYKSAVLFVDRVVACGTVLYSFCLLPYLFSGGEGVREFALPLIAVSIFLFLKQLCFRSYSLMDAAVVGGCFSSSFLLLPNLVALWIPFGVAVAVAGRHDRMALVKYFGVMAVSAALVLLPFIGYAVAAGSLRQSLFCIFEFNRNYCHISPKGVYRGFIYVMERMDKIYAGVVFILYLWLLGSDRMQSLKVQTRLGFYTLPVVLIFTLIVSCSLAGRDGEDYATPCVPLLALLAAIVAETVRKEFRVNRKWIVTLLLMASWKVVLLDAEVVLAAYHYTPSIPERVARIKMLTSANETIGIYGSDSSLYYLSNRSCFSYYHFTTPIFDVPGIGPRMIERYCGDLEQKGPPLLLVHRGPVPASVQAVLDRKYVPLRLQDPSYVFYVKGAKAHGDAVAVPIPIPKNPRAV